MVSLAACMYVCILQAPVTVAEKEIKITVLEASAIHKVDLGGEKNQSLLYLSSNFTFNSQLIAHNKQMSNPKQWCRSLLYSFRLLSCTASVINMSVVHFNAQASCFSQSPINHQGAGERKMKAKVIWME